MLSVQMSCQSPFNRIKKKLKVASCVRSLIIEILNRELIYELQEMMCLEKLPNLGPDNSNYVETILPLQCGSLSSTLDILKIPGNNLLKCFPRMIFHFLSLEITRAPTPLSQEVSKEGRKSQPFVLFHSRSRPGHEHTAASRSARHLLFFFSQTTHSAAMHAPSFPEMPSAC